LGFTPEEAFAAMALSQDPERQSVLTQLQEIESQIALQRALSTDNHPTIVNLIEQRNSLKNLLEEENRRIFAENTISANVSPRVFVNQDASRQALIQQLIETQNQLETLSSRYQSMLRNQAQTAEQLNAMPDLIKEYNDLQRQIELDTNILNQLTSQREALSVDAAQKGAPWEILAEPQIPVDEAGNFRGSPSDPIKKLAAGVGGGLILGLLGAIAIEKKRDVYYEASDLEYAFGFPILGTFPIGGKSQKKQKQSLDDEDSFFTDPKDPTLPNALTNEETFESTDTSVNLSGIYTNLHFHLPHLDEKQYILISSLNPADGQGYFCANLTKTATDLDQKVLVIDGNPLEDEIAPYFDNFDPRRTDNFGEYVHKGLKEVLPGTVLADISIVTAGREQADLPLNIGTEETQSVIQSIAKDYNLILYNTTFFLESHELCLLANKTEGIVMVVKLEQTPQSSLNEAVKRIKNYNLNFLGFVVVE
jgi:Mrp family chromosome partitioning ATPase